MVRDPNYSDEDEEADEAELEEEEVEEAPTPAPKKKASRPATKEKLEEVNQPIVVRMPVFESPAMELFYNKLVVIEQRINQLGFEVTELKKKFGKA